MWHVTDLLFPAKDLITNTDEYPLDYYQTIKFMTKVNGVRDILALVATYTNDIQGVLNLMFDICKVVTHKSIKNKCVRVQRRIKKALSKVSKPKASPASELSNDLNLDNLLHEPSGDNQP
ncbi:hypothetical protein Zmor_011334 [Zophobas morio]|uniref:Uncharacterized protein n=1 Tax=Zophobas morio TaxID=2755281 RepID=A0AA38ILU4_9CUCU|nr:hypothetical protein Zmor_011334 [Zophobas morio]